MSTSLTRTARQVFSATNIDGSLRQISDAEASIWGTEVEQIAIYAALANKAVPFTSKSVMDSNRGYANDAVAWVLSDPLLSNRGVYKKQGAAGVGSWVRQGDLPLGPKGDRGEDGLDGTDGVNGSPGRVDAVGTLANRPAPGSVAAGYVYVANDQTPNPLAYVRTAAGTWSEGFSVFANSAVVKTGDTGLGTLVFSAGATAVLGKDGEGNEAARVSQVEAKIDLRRPPSRPALKALDTTKIKSAYLTEFNREGQWLFRSGDYSFQIASDPREGLYVKADGVPATEGAWVRQYNGGISPKWFGALGVGFGDDYPALAAWADIGGVGWWPKGDYPISALLNLTKFNVLYNDNPTVMPTFDQGFAVFLSYSPQGVFVENKEHHGKIRVFWPSRDWTKDRTSFFIQNTYNSRFEIESLNATCGLHMNGSGSGSEGMGCVYNNVYIGTMFNAQSGVRLTSQDGFGWCNANVLHGGHFFGSATAAEQAAGIYAATAGHFHVENSPYANNGNHFERPSLEWVGPNFRLARIGGYRNTLRPSYTEADVGEPWFHIFGTENVLHWETPSLGILDPLASGRVSILGAINPKIHCGNNYDERSHGVPDYLTNTGSREVMRLQNKGSGDALVLQVDNAVKGLEVRSSTNVLLRTVTGFGPEMVNGGNNVVLHAAAKPTGLGYSANGFDWTWKAGDRAINTQPAVTGSAGNLQIVEGWVCVTGTNGTTPATWYDMISKVA